MSSPKKRVALITTWFPPLQGVAVNRMEAFAKYLSEDFSVTVFSLHKQEGTTMIFGDVQVYYTSSGGLSEKLKSNPADRWLKHKFKTGLRILLSYIVRNPLNGWKNKTLRKLSEIHHEHPFDAIVSSFSPQEAHLVALEFCKQFRTVLWIADMRDEMSLNPGLNEHAKRQMHEIEKQINEFASGITSVSAPIVEGFRELCPNVGYFEEIRNGFDHELEFPAPAPRTSSVFQLGYFGSFYGGRKPDHFFQALVNIRSRQPDFRFHVHVFGAHHNFTIPPVVRENLTMHPGVPYLEAIKQMSQMDANVLIHPASGQKGVFTGKFFDYLSVRKPVLAFVDPEDVAAQLLREMNAGYAAEFSDVAANEWIILKAYEDWGKDEPRIGAPEAVRQLHRRLQVKKLAKGIHQLLDA